jgi:transposase-like protein
MPQLVVTAVLVEGRSKSEVAREYGVVTPLAENPQIC